MSITSMNKKVTQTHLTMQVKKSIVNFHNESTEGELLKFLGQKGKGLN